MGTAEASLEQVGRWASGLAGRGGRRPPARVLGALAAALGVPWDGPGARPEAEPELLAGVEHLPGWLLLDSAREALTDQRARRRLGAHHTPPELARRLVALALGGLRTDVVVADRACGGGAFLVAAGDLLVAGGADPARVVEHQLVGVDLDPLAAATTRAALRCWARAAGVERPTEPAVRVGDGLRGGWSADVVVGNPPFLSPLGSATAGSPAATAMRRRLGVPYADVAGLFLLASLEAVAPGGRVLLIQPESVLVARDARPVRAAVGPSVEGIWIAGEAVFGATVRVCAPLLRKGGSNRRIARWSGRMVEPAGSAPWPPSAGAGGWSTLRPVSAPEVELGDGPVVGDIASATAGFRDEFYALAAAVSDGGPGLPLVTAGLVDPGRVLWGERPARIAGRRYERPTVDPARLAVADERTGRWLARLRVPKVLVATQTRVVEAVADPDGTAVPMTPVVAVVPAVPADVWRLAAALTSPAVSAWAVRRFGAAALSADAMKLSARQVLTIPLPADPDAWEAATACLRAGDVVGCAAALAAGDEALLGWWCDRLPAGRRPQVPPDPA